MIEAYIKIGDIKIKDAYDKIIEIEYAEKSEWINFQSNKKL